MTVIYSYVMCATEKICSKDGGKTEGSSVEEMGLVERWKPESSLPQLCAEA